MHAPRESLRRIARGLLVLLLLSIGFAAAHTAVHPHPADAGDACVTCHWTKHTPTIASTAAPACTGWEVEASLPPPAAVLPLAVARGAAASRAPPSCA
jgi:hypothetical protein